MSAAREVRSGSVQAWAVAVRPRSLLVAISPVLVGATLGFERTGAIDLLAASLVLGAALLMQVITNMQNDVGYTVRGGDSSGTRTGLPRATANGWLSVRHVRLAIVSAAIVAVGLGLALVAYRGWPVLAIGVASLLAALAYMGGPRPIAYTPFGEATVFVFFGLVAVLGTDWVLTGSVGALLGRAAG
jgi:1,4-dihydroxy-2-naphthoate polyprenyltransferase